MKYELRSTEHFDRWLKKLKDVSAKRRMLARFDMVGNGHFGDHKQLDEQLFELRMFYGSGYRVYFSIKEEKIVFLLVGGDKASQQRDIVKARKLLHELED